MLRLMLVLLMVTGTTTMIRAQTGSGLEQPDGLQWWQRGQDTWCYKDDWHAKFLSGNSQKKTYRLSGKVKEAAVCVWGRGGYTFKLNGQVVGADIDNGTIEVYDIKALLREGENAFEIEGGGEVVLEGAAVLEDGTQVLFHTDATWNDGKARASDRRRGGPRGYGGDTHNARIMAVTAEDKAKVVVNGLNSARRRILDRDCFEFRRLRDPREVLDLAAQTPPRETWAKIETLLADAQPAIKEATALIKEGKYDQAVKTAQPAVAKTAEAENLLKDLLAGLKRRTATRAEGLEPAGSGGHTAFNTSHCNRLGWVASAEPLDNDPIFWEFDLAPPGAGTVHLAGKWEFLEDPKDQGVKASLAEGGKGAGWKHIYAPSKLGWERQGITQDNYEVKGRCNKPYNGLAWYRKTLLIPKEWKGDDLVLRPGIIGNNTYWLAVNGKFLQSTEEAGSAEQAVRIPAAMIRFGDENTFSLRVFNSNNFGGIVNPLLRLSRAKADPANRRSICGIGVAREVTYSTAEGTVTQVTLSSALSPAAVVATSGKTIRLSAWRARGYENPDHLAFASGGKIRVHKLGALAAALGEGAVVRAWEEMIVDLLGENWLMLWKAGNADETPRPVLIVLEHRPVEVVVVDDGLGGKALELRFDRPGARVALIRPFGPFDIAQGKKPLAEALTPDQAKRIRLWSRALLRYPIGYAERVAFDSDTCTVGMAYEYLEFDDDWNTEPLQLAPLPMLFSYAIEHDWPKAKADTEATNLGCRADSGYYPQSDCGEYRARADSGYYPQSDCGEYRAVVGAGKVAYSFDRMEPPWHLKGAGTLGEELRREEMWGNFGKWGFNSCRPQIQFYGGRGWPSFFQTPGAKVNKWNENSKIVFGGEALETFDRVLKWHRDNDLVFIINWFWNYDRPENEPNRAIVNSSRYWKFDPTVRQHVIDIWVKIAEHCKDLPPDTVIYDFVNEPSDVQWEPYNRFMKDISAAIRKVDKVHYLAQEAGGGWAQAEDLDMTEPTGDEKTIYEFHFYGPHTGDCHRYDLWFPRYQMHVDHFRSREQIEERLLPVIRFGIRSKAQMFHGEFGTSFIGPDEAPRRWLESLLGLHEKYRTHWNWWNYSGGNINRTGLIAGERINPLVRTLSEYARMRPPE